jgi:hypothetical protein
MVVDVQPSRQGPGSLLPRSVRAQVGAFFQEGAVEALHLPLVSGRRGCRKRCLSNWL